MGDTLDLRCEDDDGSGNHQLERSAFAVWSSEARDWVCTPDDESVIECIECGGSAIEIKE